MAIFLDGTTEYFYLLSADWARLLQLAYVYNWSPAGAEPSEAHKPAPTPGVMYPPLVDWGGEDYARNGYIVQAPDALQMGWALQQALADIPDHDTVKRVEIASIIDGNGKYEAHGASTESQYSYLRRGSKFTRIEAESEHFIVPANGQITDYFSGAMKPCVQNFISFCEHGGFSIISLGRDRRATM